MESNCTSASTGNPVVFVWRSGLYPKLPILIDLHWCCFAVTLAERGQNKHLVILNTEWQEVDKVPLDIGPKHYKINGVNPEIPEKLRKGDKLRWEIVAGDEIKIREMEKSIRRKGGLMVIFCPRNAVVLLDFLFPCVYASKELCEVCLTL